MKYKGYEIDLLKDNAGVIISNVKDFEPSHIFDCGQCFRWIKENDGSYTGVASGRVLNVSKEGQDVILRNTNIKEFQDIWFDYFDLGRDYSNLKENVSKDIHMKAALEFGHGIRMLKQDFNEMLISFIISANNRIPMIMKVVDKLSQMYGEKLEYNGNTYYDFPQISSIAASDLIALAQTKMGFRAKYVLNSSKTVFETDITGAKLRIMETYDAKHQLMQLSGVGSKIADCVLLFSGIKNNVFPTDVWVKRVMEELYLKRETSLNQINEFGTTYFGENAGLAQQYLFYYARQKKIGTAAKGA